MGGDDAFSRHIHRTLEIKGRIVGIPTTTLEDMHVGNRIRMERYKDKVVLEAEVKIRNT